MSGIVLPCIALNSAGDVPHSFFDLGRTTPVECTRREVERFFGSKTWPWFRNPWLRQSWIASSPNATRGRRFECGGYARLSALKDGIMMAKSLWQRNCERAPRQRETRDPAMNFSKQKIGDNKRSGKKKSGTRHRRYPKRSGTKRSKKIGDTAPKDRGHGTADTNKGMIGDSARH